MADVIKYLGDGNRHHTGVPARDLAREEFEALAEDLRAVVRASELYDFGRGKPKAAPTESRDGAPASERVGA